MFSNCWSSVTFTFVCLWDSGSGSAHTDRSTSLFLCKRFPFKLSRQLFYIMTSPSMKHQSAHETLFVHICGWIINLKVADEPVLRGQYLIQKWDVSLIWLKFFLSPWKWTFLWKKFFSTFGVKCGRVGPSAVTRTNSNYGNAKTDSTSSEYAHTLTHSCVSSHLQG